MSCNLILFSNFQRILLLYPARNVFSPKLLAKNEPPKIELFFCKPVESTRKYMQNISIEDNFKEIDFLSLPFQNFRMSDKYLCKWDSETFWHVCDTTAFPRTAYLFYSLVRLRL